MDIQLRQWREKYHLEKQLNRKYKVYTPTVITTLFHTGLADNFGCSLFSGGLPAAAIVVVEQVTALSA